MYMHMYMYMWLHAQGPPACNRQGPNGMRRRLLCGGASLSSSSRAPAERSERVDGADALAGFDGTNSRVAASCSYVHTWARPQDYSA